MDLVALRLVEGLLLGLLRVKLRRPVTLKVDRVDEDEASERVQARLLDQVFDLVVCFLRNEVVDRLQALAICRGGQIGTNAGPVHLGGLCALGEVDALELAEIVVVE